MLARYGLAGGYEGENMNAKQQFAETVKQYMKLAPYKRKCARLGKRQWNNHFYTQRDKAEIIADNLKLTNEH